MRFWAGVTDNRWYQFVGQRQFDEVNFWQPSARAPFKSFLKVRRSSSSSSDHITTSPAVASSFVTRACRWLPRGKYLVNRTVLRPCVTCSS